MKFTVEPQPTYQFVIQLGSPEIKMIEENLSKCERYPKAENTKKIVCIFLYACRMVRKL
jgi:hypothetical protein